MDEKDVRRIGRFLADRLMYRQCDDKASPETWMNVADGMGHHVETFSEHGDQPGYYDIAEAGSGVIWLNTVYPPTEQAHALVHEIAHAELNVLASGMHVGEVPGYLAGRYERHGYDDDPADARHAIACEVERLIFGRRAK